ncbi:MAG: helix-hairpin-helix domain-containing protein, partial [Thermoplasmata archaeon]
MASEDKKKASAKKDSAEAGVCAVCGGPLNPQDQCTICGTQSKDISEKKAGNPGPENPAPNPEPSVASPSTPEDPSREDAVKVFSNIKGVGESKAEILFDNGYSSLEDLKSAALEDLSAINGIGDKLAETIMNNILEPTEPAEDKKDPGGLTDWLSGDSDDALGVWLGGDAPEQKSPAPAEAASDGEDDTMGALRKWLTGEEDALETWLGESGAAPVGEVVESRELLERQQVLNDREDDIKRKEDEVDGMSIELNELKKIIEKELEAVRTGKFDPMKLIEETAELSKNLQTEVRKRKQLEEDISHLKKGTSAVVKYMKEQMVRGGGPAVKKKLAEEGAERKRQQIELDRMGTVMENMKVQLEGKLDEMP